jgi:PPM family protein phosphatase
MSDIVLRAGSCTEQGVRPNNEDRFVVDLRQNLFLVADGMGGQERGELASGMAVEIIPKVIGERLARGVAPNQAMQDAVMDANRAIIDAGRDQPLGRRMGTTAVLALQHGGKCYVAGVGDSRAYLIRGESVEQLTVDHSIAQALVISGTLTAEEARHSPYQHVLHKFLGCSTLVDGAEIRPFEPLPGDRLLLGSDGLTNHLWEDDMLHGVRQFGNPERLANHVVNLALSRGSRDNVTCVAIAFDPV